jgi:hypothetical protein
VHGTDKRDLAVEQLLRRSRPSSSDAGVTPACLDVETVAAWMDGTLGGSTLEAAQMHAADCDRCQAILATFAQIAVSSLEPEGARESRRWWVWFVPVGAAAALLVWALLPRAAPPPGVSPAGTMARNDATEIVQPEAAPERTQPPAAAEPRTPQQGVTQSSNDRRNTQGFSAPAAAPPAAAMAPLPPPAPSPAPPPPAAAATGVARAFEATALRWRVAGPRIEQSQNGVDWTAMYTHPTPLTAVAAPSATVVWAVGRGGVVLRSTDGRSFVRLPFPETVDLSAVRADDANRATVTAADGRSLSTTDAGVTWRPSLQDF